MEAIEVRTKLEKGTFHKSFDEIVTKLVEANVDFGFQHKIKARNKSRIIITCPGLTSDSKECKFVLRARAHAAGAKITSITKSHDCSVAVTRKANYKTSIICQTSKFQDASFTPHTVGATRQAQVLGGKSGLRLNKSQAYYIAKRLSNDKPENYYKQYCELESLIDTFKAEDPEGTYLVQFNPDHDHMFGGNLVKRFSRLFMCSSWSKDFYSKTNRITASDGTFLKTKVGGCLLTITVQNANGNNELLAWCLCNAENKENWVFFLKYVNQCFPGIPVDICARHKGRESNEALSAIPDTTTSNCAQHLLGNLTKDNGIKGDALINELFYKLVRARTQEYFNVHLDLIETNFGETVANWLFERRHFYATFSFLARGLPRFGQVLSNTNEQNNGSMAKARKLPVRDMILALDSMNRTRASDRKRTASKLLEDNPHFATPYAMNKLCDHQRKMTHWTVLGFSCDRVDDMYYIEGHLEFTGYSDRRVSAILEVSSDTCKCTCTCLHYEEHGFICSHAMLLLKTVNRKKMIPDYLVQFNHKRFYHENWHRETFNQQYCRGYNLVSFSGFRVVSYHWPPFHIVKPGRPRTKRYESHASVKVLKCSLCGETGHNSSTCEHPNVQLIMNRLFDVFE